MTTATQINPDFAHPLRLALPTLNAAAPESLATVGGPMTRSDIDVPISPAATPNDTQLFLHPSDASQRFWLPRYHIAQERVSNEDRYRMAFSETGAGWQLNIRLEARAAPELVNASNRFPMLEHSLDIELSYTAQGGGMSTKTLPFQEILRDETGVDATLLFSGLPQRDEVFSVLSDAARSPALIVRRKIRVAVQDRRERLGIEASAPTPHIGILQPGIVNLDPRIVRPIGPIVVHPVHPIQIALPKPVIKHLDTERVTIRGTEFLRYWIAVSNWHEYHDSLFTKSPDLPPCGANRNAARTWVDVLDGRSNARLQGFCALGKNENLQKFWVARKAADPNTLRAIKVRLTDRKTNRTVVSDALRLRPAPPPPPPEPKFLIIAADMAQNVEPTPFAFSRDLHGYIFDGLGGGGGTPGAGGLIRHRESFDGIVHSYFQDAVERNLFYFTADDFRIARRGGASRPPFMTLRVRSNGGSTENTNVTWDFAVTPYTDPARLESARARLATLTSQDPDAIEFQPYVTPAVKFTIQRPTASGRVSEERPSNALMLERPIFETLAIPVVDFQLAFDAMLGRTASVLAGTVEIGVEGWDTETRPFIADFASLAGPVIEVQADVESGAATLSLTNVTESLLTLTDPVFRVRRGDRSETLRPGSSLPAATELAAGETTTVFATLPDLPGAGPLSLALESGAEVKPDEAAILDAILDRSTLSYFRDIDVMAVSILFDAPLDRPQDQIHTLMVEFESGNTVVLNRDTLTGTSRIDYPFDDVILRRVEFDDNYRYSRTIVRIDLRTERDAEPKVSNAQTLLLSDTHIVQPG